MSVRVVVTGLGVIAPNGNGLRDFELALRKGSSGLRANAEMREAGFGCQVAGVPQGVDAIATSYFAEDELLAMNSSHRFASSPRSRPGWTPGSRARSAATTASIGRPARCSARASAAWTRSPRASCRTWIRRRSGGSAAPPSSR